MLAMNLGLHSDTPPSTLFPRHLGPATQFSSRPGMACPETAGNWLVYLLGDHSRAAEIDRALGLGFDQVRMADGGPLVVGVHACRPDLIILADDRPSLDLVRALRASRAARYLPIILLGTSCQPENIADAFDAGVSDYVCLPFYPSQLRARAMSLVLSGQHSRPRRA